MKYQFLVVLVCLSSWGCSGGADIARVSGTITMDGQPLADASVVFVPESGRPAGARTDEQGRYELNFTKGRRGAMLGKNRVLISTAADPSETPAGEPIPARKETVPARYNAASELEFTVEGGKRNIADFAITSEGELPIADDAVVSEDED